MRRAAAQLAAIAFLVLGASGQEPIETRHANGALHERYSVDTAGRKSGPYEQYRSDGTIMRRCVFAADQLNGRADQYADDGKTLLSAGEYRKDIQQGNWVYFEPATARRKKVQFKNGALDGTATILIDDKVVSRQKWKLGELEKLDDIEPFPIPAAALRDKLGDILAPPTAPIDTTKDALAAERMTALRRLKAYRALCGLPHDSLTLVPEWNALCDAAAEICRLNGAISHTPPRPPGVSDERYRQAQEGASHSNLAYGSSAETSVDFYMDDSDASNIDRIGHRRWCLNPLMSKTGFGISEDYSAMWSMDQGGKAVRGLEAVLYPPAGWCPVDMFSPRHVFSISLLRAVPRESELRASVRLLDEDWVPGAALAMERIGLAGGGFGGAACITFRASEFRVELGVRYLVEVSTDAGETQAFRYVVAFCEASTTSK